MANKDVSTDMWIDVCSFHEQFEIPQNELPGFLPDTLMQYRMKFLAEELEEFHVAYKDGEIIKAFDALIDIVYVALGTAWMMNLPWEGGWSHVQAANMLKERAATADESKRGVEVDVVKPAGWIAPDELLRAELIFLTHQILMDKFMRAQQEAQGESADDDDDC